MANIKLFTLGMILAAGTMSAGAEERKPNIVLIMADDLGYGDLGCYGSKRVKTPHIDRLAREGLRFTDFHSNGSTCSPTRAALLTGRYQQRSGVVEALSERSPGLKADEHTMAEYLKSAEYTTAVFGKWHLGSRPDSPALPNAQGFDLFIGARHGGVDYVSHIDRYGRPDWWHNNKPLKEDGYATDLLSDHAIKFVEQHHEKPFFLYLSHLAIHFPWMAPGQPAYRKEGGDYDNIMKIGPNKPEEVPSVVDRMIENIDDGVGRLMKAIESLPPGRETLVVFTSDNGGYRAYTGVKKVSSNGVLRGQKAGMYEGAHRVPCIAWWPGRIVAGKVTEATTMTMDLLPTFLELADVAAPKGDNSRAFDGVSLVPLLMKHEPPAPRTLFWKAGDMKAVREGPWKIVIEHGSSPRLYHLERDLSEKQDISSSEPEQVKKMIAALEKWEQQFAK